MKLTENQKFGILQMSSGHMLTEKYPNNWEEMEFSEQIEFIEQSAWSEIAFDQSSSDIIDAIDDVANCTISFIEKILQ